MEPTRRRPPLAALAAGRGTAPISFAAAAVVVFGPTRAEQPVFHNIPAAVEVEGPLDSGLLRRALAEVARRHESLRTTVAARDGQPFQRIALHAEVALAVLDLGSLSEAERAAEVRRQAQAEARRPFDLSTGPLWRVALLRLGPQRHVLLLTMHHVISDGWSLGVL